MVALLMMGTGTAGIAFRAVYSDIGVASIVLLSILRFAQGLALGGSWDGLPSFLALNAPQNRRGWYPMIPQLVAPLGFMLAPALFAFLFARLTQTGRASFRECVFQIVYISVVSVPLIQ